MTVTALADLVGRPIDDLPSPAVMIDVPTLRRNIAQMADVASGFGVALRPHWKTSKCVEVARMQLDAGAERADVMTKMQWAGGAVARQDDRFC